MSIRLMVIDDHEIIRSGLRKMIAGSEIQLIAESNSAVNVLTGISQYHPDVILLDVRLEEGDGLSALGRIKIERPQIPVLMLSSFDNPTYVARSVALGASGYLLKMLLGIRSWKRYAKWRLVKMPGLVKSCDE